MAMLLSPPPSSPCVLVCALCGADAVRSLGGLSLVVLQTEETETQGKGGTCLGLLYQPWQREMNIAAWASASNVDEVAWSAGRI